MVHWTEEQKTAIEARNSNLLVTAAAGSGKTAVLVQRVIDLVISDGIDIDKLLIVTFTKAAAAEMKDRIRKAILSRLDDPGEDREKLRRQLNLLNKAQISTLHSFCQSIVKNNFHLTEIDPAFKVGEETEMLLLKKEALEETFENEYEAGSPLFFSLVEMFSPGRDDQRLMELVLEIYDFIQSKPEPYEWLEEKARDLAVQAEDFDSTYLCQTIKEQIGIQLDGALELTANAVKIAEKANGPARYLPVLYEDLDRVKELQETLGVSLERFIEELLIMEFSRLPAQRNDCDITLRDEAKANRDAAKKIINDLKQSFMGKTLEELITDLNRMHPYIKYLTELVVRFKENYQARKAEKGVLDFNDLEHYALQILQNEKAAQEYRERFTYIFIDEYQDSNQVQEAFINRIKKENNLFMVGDVKQSIYRFRLADPMLFMEKYNSFADGKDETDRRVFLRKNFRSQRGILDAVNYIFKNIMSEAFGEINYDDDAALYAGKADTGNGAAAEPIEVIIIDNNKDNGEEPAAGQADEIEELNKIQTEAHVIAGKIKELLGKTIFDPQINGVRNMAYKDMVILLRTTKNWINVFTEVFNAEGIPSYADVDTGYLNAIEVNMFVNMLKIIDNARQDIELISVLRSPLFQFTVEELAAIRLGSTEKTFYAALTGYNEPGELKEKIADFLSRLHRWQKMAGFLPLEELIWRLMLDSGYLHYVTSMPGGVQRAANIRLLFEKAKSFQQSTMHGLFNFLYYLDQLTASRYDMGTAKTLGENDNVVRIMSIHKSKGLEFPVVIMAGLGKQFNMTDTNQTVLLHKDLGIGPRYVDSELRVKSNTIIRNAIKEKIKFENLSEEMRILYVAMTRAQEKLIMTGSVGAMEKCANKWCKTTAPYNLAQARSAFDWIGSVLIRHPDGKAIREQSASGWEENMLWQDHSHWQIKIINKHNVKLSIRQHAVKKEELIKGLKDFALENESPWHSSIINRLNWVYPYQTAGQIPAKLSVTQIQRQREKKLHHAELNLPALINTPHFREKEQKISGMEKGTVFHFVLQHLDLKKVNSPEQIKAQIGEMVYRQLLKPEEAEAVEIGNIIKFYQSELGQRVLNSPAVKRETPFNMLCKAAEVLGEAATDSDEELMIQGVIDLYFVEDGKLVLVDYKTDHITAENRQAKINAYQTQMELYQRALESILHKEVKESYLYLLDINEAVPI